MKVAEEYQYPDLAEKAVKIRNSHDFPILIEILSDLKERIFRFEKDELDHYVFIFVKLLEDFLYNTIEDNYYDSEELARSILQLKKLFLSIISSNRRKMRFQEISENLRDYFDSYRVLIEMPELPREDILVETKRKSDELVLPIKFCHYSSPLIVGGYEMPFALIFDELICNPEIGRKVVDSFCRILEKDSHKNIDKYCFIEKRFGPVGALSVLSSIVSRTNREAFIYRPGHWDKDAKIFGQKPKRGDRIAIIYDLVLTGKSIKEAADFVKNNYDASVSHAVVIYNYSDLKKIGDTKVISLLYNPMKNLENEILNKYEEEMQTLRDKWIHNEIRDLDEYEDKATDIFQKYAGVRFFADSSTHSVRE